MLMNEGIESKAISPACCKIFDINSRIPDTKKNSLPGIPGIFTVHINVIPNDHLSLSVKEVQLSPVKSNF